MTSIPLLPVGLVVTALISLCAAQNLYYVTPLSNTTCPGDPCLTLSEYVREAEQYFTSDAIFQLLPGDHFLEENVDITNMHYFSLIGSSGIESEATRIICSWSVHFWFSNVTEVKISGLHFAFCGGLSRYLAAVNPNDVDFFELTNCSFVNSTNAAVFVFEVEFFKIASCLFQDTSESALIILDSSGSIESSNFIGNQASSNGGGILSVECEVTIVDNHFSMNIAAEKGGAIKILSSVVYVHGNTFDRNTANGIGNAFYGAGHGGGIAAFQSTVTFTGDSVFTNNSAQGSFASSGGAIYLTFCEAYFDGNTSFVANSASASSGLSSQSSLFSGFQTGGGIQIESSNVTFSGSTIIEQNVAVQSGAGIYVQNSSVDFTGDTLFANNSQGGLWAQTSTVAFTGNAIFLGNSALFGGGIAADSPVSFNGSISFIENSAISQGGAIWLVKSNFLFPSVNLFVPKPAILENDGKLTIEGNTAPIGGGIYLFFSEMISMGDVAFLDNTADLAGAMNVLNANMTSVGSITFVNNSAMLAGALNVQTASVSLSGDNTFINNTADVTVADSTAGAINTLFASLALKGSTLITDSIASKGSGIHASHSNLSFEGDTTFSNNLAGMQEGGGVYVIGSTLIASGNITFLNNSATTKGGAIAAINSVISMSGNSRLTNNSAVEGGAISLEYSSQLNLHSPLTMTIERNIAERGAAILVTDFASSAVCSDHAELAPLVKDAILTPCFFVPDSNFPNVQLIFVNNSATEYGNVLYGGFLNRCKPPVLNRNENSGFDLIHQVSRLAPNNDAIGLFNQLSQLSDGSPVTQSGVSSDPIQVCICVNNTSSCTSNTISVAAVRGDMFTVSVVALDQVNRPIPASIRAEPPSDTGSNAEFGELQTIQSIDGICTDLQYSLFSPDDSEEFVVYAEGPCGNSGTAGRTIHMDFLPCPDGFQLSLSKCICESGIQKFTDNCRLSDRTVQRHNDFWFGPLYENGSYTGVTTHPHCPFDYCISETKNIPLNESDEQCAFNRSATLCGSCQQDLSLVLGSSKCKKCSNVYLLLLIPFVVSGIVLVVVLLSLKLTVAVGTINGLIFYANIVAVNRSIFFPFEATNFLTVFIAWLNLDLGIETCFFNGMDTYTKVWLQFLFPIYLWIMVGILIIAGYYSTVVARMLGRNPVAVLATVFLLSYTKLLRTIIATMYFDTQLSYPDGVRATVWLYDGNIPYLRGKHIPLFLFATLALLVLFLPYTIVLFLGQWIQAKSNWTCFRWIANFRVKAILDAYHGPYSDGHRYWTGFLLLLRCALLLVFAFNALGDSSVNLLTIASTCLALAILTTHVGPIYKSRYLNVLESSFILNLGLLASATYHVNQAGGNQKAVVYTSVGVALSEFVGIIIYHICLQVRDIRCLKEYTPYTVSNGMLEIALEQASQEPSLPPTVSYITLRESLLEPDNQL